MDYGKVSLDQTGPQKARATSSGSVAEALQALFYFRIARVVLPSHTR
jgi:hypothetical protein